MRPEQQRRRHVHAGKFALDEVVEASLLLKEILSCGLRGLRFQRQVHALVAPVLLRVAGLDALEPEAEAQPPDREL